MSKIPDISGMTLTQQVRYAILCAWEVSDDAHWREWAQGWLNGGDRSARAAKAEAAAEWAAAGAEWAAAAAEWAARAARAAAEWAAARAARWAKWAEAEAEWAGKYAQKADPSIDLHALARRAITEEKAP